MLGLCQRCIIVAHYGGTIEIGENCRISGSSIYSWKPIKIGNCTHVGVPCKIIDNDFHLVELENATRLTARNMLELRLFRLLKTISFVRTSSY